MEKIIYLLVTFGYVLTFGILGAFTLMTKIPKEDGMKNYKKARTALGCGLTILAIFSLTRMIFPQTYEHYLSFWLLVTFTLIHSWLTYSSLLFLMETPRYKIVQFLIDGSIPTALMLITGTIGAFIPSIQDVMIVIFGVIFGIKCAWMFYTCMNEYRKCKKDVENYYDQEIDIRWIGSLIWISVFMSALTIVAFYVHSIHLIYYLLIPVIYVYIVIKVFNFMPRKIDAVRHQNTLMEKGQEEQKEERVKDLVDKVRPKVEQWISEKKFCNPDLTIKDVATQMGTNHNYLSQYLNNYKGMTFQIWLNTLRIEKSKILLTSGEKISIEEVGVRVGIPQSYNFSRWFKAITGTTPYQFRKQHS